MNLLGIQILRPALLLAVVFGIQSYDFLANCRSPLGMESGVIPDSALLASSMLGENYGPQQARLHLSQPYPGYRAGNVEGNETWIMVKLGNDTVITGISTQGYGNATLKEWVTKYSLMFSAGSEFIPFKETSGQIKNFTGNNDTNGVQHHDVPLPVITSTVMIRPLEWNNNVGLRMELYGCEPGYYFLARFTIPEEYTLFTLAFLDKESEDYQTWSADTMIQIKDIVQYIPGFLAVKFRHFRLSTDALLVSAEVEIHCIKEAGQFIAETLGDSVGPANSMFASKMDFIFPVNSSCTFPEVYIYLNKTISAATEVLTTSTVTFRADITFCKSQIKSIQSSLWEFMIIDKTSPMPALLTIHNSTEHVFDPRFCLDCYPVYMYVRFTAHIKQLQGAILEDFGFLKIDRPALVAKITGPEEATKGIGADIVLDASDSYDPDSVSDGTLHFSWLCKRKKDEAIFKGECEYGRTEENGKLFVVHVNRLKSKHIYDFNLTVSKRNRTGFVIHELKVLPSVQFTFRCTGNCGNKIVQSKGMKLIPECVGRLCSDVTVTDWSIHAHVNTSIGNLWKRIALEKTSGLRSPPSSFVVKSLRSHNIITKTRDPIYKIKATIEIRVGKDIIKEESHMVVRLNSPPFIKKHSGDCFIKPLEGYAVETTFNITCVGWLDEDGPLKYEFRYYTSAGLVINDPNKGVGMSTLSTKLPVGDRLHNFQLPIDIQIKDSLGDLTVKRIEVKVRDKYSGNAKETLYGIANNRPTKLDDYVKTGKHTKACDLAISVLSLVEKREGSSDSEGQNDEEISKEKAGRVKNNIIELIKGTKINSKELMTKVSTVVAMATKDKDEISQDSQVECLRLLDEVAEFLSNIMTNNTEGADNLSKEVSKNMLLGLGNILKISSEDASVTKLSSTLLGPTEDYKKKSKKIAQKALETIWKLRDCLVVDVADDEPIVITGSFLSMVLYRQTNQTMTKVGERDFTLPSYEMLFNEQGINKANITTKVVLFKSNPYTWHKSASTVKSWVIDVVLQKEDKTNLNIFGLKDPVQLYIPQNSDRVSSHTARTNTVQHFVKPSYDVNESTLIQYHKINLTYDHAVVFVKLKPEILTYTPLRVYVRFSDFPTPTEHNFATVIPICENLGYKEVEMDCVKDSKNYVFSFTSSDTGRTGIHYIGIHYYVNSTYDLIPEKEERMASSDDDTAKERTKRSCGGSSGRQKRSCVGVKDPPPSPTPAPVILKPIYNASTDLNYTLSVNIGSCLYWSEDKEEWTDEGCNVTSDVVSGSILCLCNHLSAFGGDFFVAPNPIDFRKVFSKFPDLGETKNFVVMTTVCSMLFIYFIGLVFTRRADKRDQLKKIPNVYLPDGEEYGVHHYHISVATGMWMGCGTTANVGLIIYGEDYSSRRIILNDSAGKKTFFARASVNTFTVSLPRNLGPLYKIRMWHDNTGQSPGWFLLDVVITELESQQKWYFIANRWLAVEKGSGEVDFHINASNKKEASRFKNLFYSRVSRRLADGHLWISVLARPPQSSFTRTQRLSCCMSVFFSAMITNAMFYDFGEAAQDTFQLGPLTMSWTQVRIGIQSAMIALPVNAVIVAIFRNVKPKKKQNKDSNLEEENSPKGLPHYVIYIAWLLCILAILSSAFFTVLYSMSWGSKISNEWLTSVLVSFFQDVIVLQPIQVVLLASLLSILIRKPVKHVPVHGLPHRKNQYESDFKVQPPEEEQLIKSRSFWLKLRKMFRSATEIILFVIFVSLLFVVCYGNRDTSRYHLTKSLKDIFVAFDKRVNSTETFWNWTRERLVPGVFFSEWYNGEQVELDEGFISSGYPFLVGMPRLRQIRVQTGFCQVEDLIDVVRCLPYYSSTSEDKTQHNLRDWTPIYNISAFEASFNLNDLCPKPWRYQTADALGTLFFHGYYATYNGGGYIADLGYNAATALGVIDDLENNGWIDERTFAVFVEFTVYDPSSTLFSAAKYLYERYPTGGTKTTGTFDTLMIYYPVNPSYRSFYLACQLLLVLLIFGLFAAEIVKLYVQRCRYFTHVWNLVDILQITSAVAAMIQYFFRAKFTSDYVQRVQRNPFETSSSDYIVLWCNLEIWLLSFVVFLVTIKMLRLIKFNHHICHLTHTVKSAAQHLVSYSVVFTATLLAYTQLGTLLFGSNAVSYSNMARSLRMLLERLLGNNMYTKELKAVNDVMGQLFTFAYSFSIAIILINMFLSILNASYIEVRLLKQGRYPDVELALFAWRYLLQKGQTFWHDAKRLFGNSDRPKLRLKRRNAKYFKAREADILNDSDRFFCTKYDEHQSASYRSEIESAEECRCLSNEEVRFEEAMVDDFDDIDIDLVDEYSSLRDIKKTLLQMGTSFFISKNEWSSCSLNDNEDDRDEVSSLKSEWSYGSESDQSLFNVNMGECLKTNMDEPTKETLSRSGRRKSASSDLMLFC